MTDPFLEDCGGWTPAPDILTKKYGFESAYLWGRLRRLCQLGKGTYTISPEALGKRFGMSRRTVIDRLKAMIQDGYIEDLTPGVRNKAHTYSTQKGEDKILSGMQISHTEDDIPLEDNEGIEPEKIDVGMRNLHSDDAEIAHQDDAGMQKLPNRYAENAYPGMQNLHLNRESLETLKEREESRPPPLDDRQELARQLTETCGYDATVLSNGTRQKLEYALDVLQRKKATPELVKKFGEEYWWGKSPPKPDQLTEEWHRFLQSKKKPRESKTKVSAF